MFIEEASIGEVAFLETANLTKPIKTGNLYILFMNEFDTLFIGEINHFIIS